MATFTVNGKSVTVEKNQKLIRFLRDDAAPDLREGRLQRGRLRHLPSSSSTASPPRPASRRRTSSRGRPFSPSKGSHGLGKAASIPIAFGEAGRCSAASASPGWSSRPRHCSMRTRTPPREEAAFAHPQQYLPLHGVCQDHRRHPPRGGGSSARESIPAPAADDWQLGSRVHRLDVEEKVLGYGQYPDDVYVDGMCYGGAVRSAYARARVLAIDTSAAEALEGVICVLTAEGHPRRESTSAT